MHFVSRLRPGRLSSRTTAILGVKDNFSLSMPTQHNRSFGKKMIKKKSPEDEASEEDEIDAELNQNWGEYKLTPQQQQVFDHVCYFVSIYFSFDSLEFVLCFVFHKTSILMFTHSLSPPPPSYIPSLYIHYTYTFQMLFPLLLIILYIISVSIFSITRRRMT